MHNLTIGLAAFAITATMMPVVIRLAKACNCMDIPGGRRGHEQVTPRWGGLGFWVGVFPLLFMVNGASLNALILAGSLLLGMGVVDDLKTLGWKTKFIGMAVAATVVIFGGEMVINHIGFSGLVSGDLGWFGIPFTYVSIIGLTSAINLLDGLNGLAGGVSLLAFLFMGVAAVLTGDSFVASVCFAYVGALAAFLLYNFPKARVFMGDTGSTLLGFCLSVVAISLTQGPASNVSPMFPVLLLLIPIFDTLRVICVRLRNGKNPFLADRLHLHYLFVDSSFSPVHVTLIYWILTMIFGGIALTRADNPSIYYPTTILSGSLLLWLFSANLNQKSSTGHGIALAELNGEQGLAPLLVQADLHRRKGP